MSEMERNIIFKMLSLNWPPDGVRWRSSRNLLEFAISPTDGI